MKNKNGFTLIELIAVIVIIGIIAILIVPTVSKYIVDTRESTYDAHERSMSEAAESYTIECIQNNGRDCEIPGPNEERTIYLSELIDSDFIDKLGDPAKNGSYCNPNTSYVKIYNTNNNNFEYLACLYCSKYATKSVKCVTYNGDDDYPRCKILETYSEWTNESRQVRVGCEDDSSGCLRSEFKKTFTTTTNKGIITITDKSGNSTDCEVDVKIDKTPPTCEMIASGREVNGWYPLGTKFILSSYSDGESGVLTYGTGTSIHENFNKITEQTPPRGITRIFGYVQDAAGNVGICSINAKIKTEFTIHFDPNGGEGSMTDLTCMVDEDCILNHNTFTRRGYEFGGWNTRPNGDGKAYTDSGNARNIVFSGNVTLFAQWNVITYDISYTLNGGNVTGTNPNKYNVETNTFTLINPSKIGYTFAGWTGTNGNTPQKTITIAKGSIGDRSYTANWDKNTYTIAFAGNGNTGGSTGNKSCTYDQDCVLTSNGFTKTGYTFNNWTNGSNTYNNGATVKNLTSVNGATVTLTASWNANSYTITFAGNGNTSGSTGNKNCTYDQDCELTANGFTKTGYNFSGWTYGSNTYADRAKVKNLTATNGGTVTLTASWALKSVTCTAGNYLRAGELSCTTCTANHYCPGGTFYYNTSTNQGINDCPSGYSNGTGQSVRTSCKITCNANTRVITSEGACSGGCNTGYNIGQHEVSAGSLSSNCNANTYTITFAGNENTGGSTADVSCTYDTNCTLTSNGFTKTGYEFDYWSNGSNTYTNGATVKNLTSVNGGTVTLTANWKESYVINDDMGLCSVGDFATLKKNGSKRATYYGIKTCNEKGSSSCNNGFASVQASNTLKKGKNATGIYYWVSKNSDCSTVASEFGTDIASSTVDTTYNYGTTYNGTGYYMCCRSYRGNEVTTITSKGPVNIDTTKPYGGSGKFSTNNSSTCTASMSGATDNFGVVSYVTCQRSKNYNSSNCWKLSHNYCSGSQSFGPNNNKWCPSVHFTYIDNAGNAANWVTIGNCVRTSSYSC